MKISPAITSTLSRGLLQLQKHSPIIMTVAGIGALVGAGVLAARATLKLEDTVDTNEARLEHAKITTHDNPKAKALAIAHNVGDIAKLYWAPATLTVVGSVLILSGHRILHQRNAALVVAYKGLETAFANYRERVVERYGEEVDQDFRYGIRTESIEGEDGKKVKTKVHDGQEVTGEYIFDFGPANGNWVSNHEHNLFFLKSQENYANDMLRARGHIFLSEVLDSIGIPRTPASIVTGWVYDRNGGHEHGDNVVDFGIRDMEATNGYILLDFNVDGTIYDKI